MNCCGIDVGIENLSICFLVNDRSSSSSAPSNPIIYYGNIYRTSRVSMTLPRSVIEFPRSEKLHKALIRLLNSIEEFNTCGKIIIEKQLGMAKAEIIRVEAMIVGYCLAKGLDIEYLDSRIRKSFATASAPSGTVFKTTKDSSYYYIYHNYPEFYTHISGEFPKCDDIYDSVIYACICKTM